MIGGSYYWVAGSEEIHLLNHNRDAEKNEVYARKLNKEEITELPVEVVYVGPVNLVFLDDDEEAFTKLVKIIQNMNMMQDPDFVGFPVGMHSQTSDSGS